MAGKDLNYQYLNDTNDSMEGFGEINNQTMAVPFLKLAQDLTPQMKKTKPCYIEGLQLGDFFNSVTGEIYGPHVQLVILNFERIYLEWLANRGGLVGYHTPENAQNIATDLTFGKWKNGTNDLTEYYTYYIVLGGHEKEGVMIYSLTSTGIKIAKGLNRLMTTHIMDNGKTARPYYLLYDVTSHLTPKGENEYYAPKFVFNSFITEEQHLIVKEERLALPDKSVDYAQITDHASSDNPDGSGDEEDDEL
jgi:hypothetical protein